jgi:hypothetical protein
MAKKASTTKQKVTFGAKKSGKPSKTKGPKEAPKKAKYRGQGK